MFTYAKIGGSKMTLGQRLKTARENSGMKNKEVAAVLNIDSTTLSKYESNTREPTLSTIVELTKLYNTNLDWLITGEKKYLKPLVLEDEQKKLLDLFKDADEYTKGRIVGILEERAKKKAPSVGA
jgi:transcriptional regulator with XRE-family HTH domain